MAISFDDLIPQAPSGDAGGNASKTVSFDDLVPNATPKTVGGFAPREAREATNTRAQNQAAYAEQAKGVRDRQSGIGAIADTAVRGLARAVPFMDDIAAAGDYYVSGKGDSYQDALDRVRAMNKTDDDQRPVTSIGTQVVGGLAMPAFGLASQGVKGAAKLGGIYGAAYGAGQGDDLVDRGVKAATGAGLGAVAGAGIATAAPYVVKGAEKVADVFRPLTIRAKEPQAAPGLGSIADEFGVGLTKGQRTGDAPTVSWENAALRAGKGDQAQRVAQEATARQADEVAAARDKITNKLSNGLGVIDHPAQAGRTINDGVSDVAQQAQNMLAVRNTGLTRVADETNAAVTEAAQAEAARMGQRFGQMNPLDSGVAVTEGVQKAADASKAVYQGAYKTAFAGDGSVAPEFARGVVNAGGEVEIPTLGQRIVQNLMTRDEPIILDGVNNSAVSSTLNQMNVFFDRVTRDGEPLTLRAIEQGRKILLSGFRGAAKDDPTQRRALGAALDSFDNEFENVLQSALYRGDDAVLDGIRAARAAFKDHAQTFKPRNAADDAGKAVARIVEQNRTPEEVANLLFGQSQVGQSGTSVRVADRLAGILGQDSAEWGAVRGGLWGRLTGGLEAGVPADAAKIADRVEQFITGPGRTLAQRMFSADELAQMQLYAQGMRRFSQWKPAKAELEVASGLTDDLINLAQKRLSPEDMVSRIMGATTAQSKTAGHGALDIVEATFGKESQEWSGLRQALWKLTTDKPEGMTDFGPQRLSERIFDMTSGRGASISERLFTPNEMAEMRRLGTLLKAIVPPKGTDNPSGSGGVIMSAMARQLFMTIGAAVGSSFGGMAGAAVGATAGQGLQQIVNARNAAKAVKLFNSPAAQEKARSSLLGPLARKAGLVANDIDWQRVGVLGGARMGGQSTAAASPVALSRVASADGEQEPGGVGETFSRAMALGVRRAGHDVAQTASAAQRGLGSLKAGNEPKDKAIEDISQRGWREGITSPQWWAAKVGEGVGGSSPMVAGGILGAGAGSLAGPAGTVVGGVAGSAVGAVVQTLAPAYLQARQAGMDHDAAVRVAVGESAVAGAGGAAAAIAPIFRLAKGPISNALMQLFVAQPTIGTVAQAGQNAVGGRPNTVDSLIENYLVETGAGGAMHAAGSGTKRVAEAMRSPEAPRAPRERVEPTFDMPPRGPGNSPPPPSAPPAAPPPSPAPSALSAPMDAKGAATGRMDPVREPKQASVSPNTYEGEIVTGSNPSNEAGPYNPKTAPKPPRGQDAGVYTFDASTLATDAKRFQYKDAGEQGVVSGGEGLNSVKAWDPVKAGQSLVYEDHNGQLFVIDGHQRTGLARRLKGENPNTETMMSGRLLRAQDGITATQARTIAALKNIAEGSGTEIDAAKVLRDNPQALSDGTIPSGKQKVRDATGLAALSDDAFGMVVNDVVPPSFGAMVGRLLPGDPVRQEAAMRLLVKADPSSVHEADALIRQVAAEDVQTSQTGDLFGGRDIAESLVLEKAKILGDAQRLLGKEKNTFSSLVNNSGKIEEAGNSLAHDANSKKRQEAIDLSARIDAEAFRKGIVSDALTQFAQALRDGQPRSAAVAGFVQSVRTGRIEPIGENGNAVRGGQREPEAARPPATVSPDAPQDRPVAAPKPATEQTAAGEQAVIPGAEKAPPKALAQQGADAPLKPKADQKDLDGSPLFNDSVKQGDMLDAPAAKPEAKPEAAPEPAKSPDRQVIGKNRDGVDIWEDANGVRSYVEDHVRQNEAVSVGPNGERIVDASKRPDRFKTAEELAEPAKADTTNPETSTKTPEVLDQRPADGADAKKPAETPSAKPDARPDPDAAPAKASGFDPKQSPAHAVADHFAKGGDFKTIVEARRFLSENGGKEMSPKQMDEAIEHGVVMAARDITAKTTNPDAAYDALVDLYDRQPNLSTRTSTSIEQQAYSTPAPLAFLASRAAGITPQSRVYEPSAGNGMLLIGADPANVTANELNGYRAAVLRQQGFKVTQKDGADPAQGRTLRNTDPVDVVIANPPFGVVKMEDGSSRRFDMGDIQKGYKTNEIDHAIALRALEAMADDGRAVLILGGINKLAKTDEARSDAYNGKAKQEFFKTLYDRYNVVDHYTAAGELYTKQGAGWPVDVITIAGRGKSSLPLPAVKPPKVYATWDALKAKLDEHAVATEVRQPDSGLVRPEAAPDAQGGTPAGDGSVRPPRVQGGERPLGETGLDAGAIRQPADSGKLDVPVGDRAPELGGREGSGERGEPGRTDPEPSPERRPSGLERKPAAPVEEGQLQVAYQPHSTVGDTLGTLVPANMRTAVSDALSGLAEKVGDIGDYVGKSLGLTKEQTKKYLAAEQVDALALAIHNIDKGEAFIIGDQTGIGKGRVNAMMIRHAIRRGLTPIFVTEKPTLYADMWRDMSETGMGDMLGRDPRILMTNGDKPVPVGSDKNGEPTGAISPMGSAKDHEAYLRRVEAAGKLTEHDAVFTTYNQLQTVKGGDTARRDMIRALAPNAILIFDESHNAGGQKAGEFFKKKAGAPMNRAELARDIAQKAKGVFFSSATFAKNPDVMDLYGRTGMRHAVKSLSELAEALRKGGVPMQEAVSAMLAKAGQYLRRERSYDGVQYDTPLVPFDHAVYNDFSSSMAGVHEFSKHIARIAKNLDKEARAEAASVSMNDSASGAGVESTNFTSIMHNVIGQMLLAAKAKDAADMAIEALRNGEKPVLTVSNTMESFLKQYAEAEGVSHGAAMNGTFRDVMLRYLEKTRTVTRKAAFVENRDVERIYLTDAQLDGPALAAYRKAKDTIQNLDLDSLPISPIDYIHDRIRKAGFSTGEITGRGSVIDYSGAEPVYRARPGSETTPAGKGKTIRGFNNGTIDALVFNQSGATGISLHASEKFINKSRRHMILVQPEANIDTHMQMLGRVHRTGQIIPPRYSQLALDVPAEKRPAAVLAKKMASLNAATTSSKKSALTSEGTVDFMNEFGDQVAAHFLAENPSLASYLDVEIGETNEGLMRKLTGRIPLLDIKKQQQIYGDLENSYQNMIDEMNEGGANPLESRNLDLDAKILDRQQVVAGKDGDSPFEAPVFAEQMDVKRQTKPIKAEAAANMLATFAGIQGEPGVAGYAGAKAAALESAKTRMAEKLDEFKMYRRAAIDDLQTDTAKENATAKLGANLENWREFYSTLVPGAFVSWNVEGAGRLTGMVLDVRQSGKAQNPLALSTWQALIAVPGEGVVKRTFSSLRSSKMTAEEAGDKTQITRANHETPDDFFQRMNVMATGARENRVVLTGNMLAAYAYAKGGQIIRFTDAKGDLQQGIMMPKSIDTLKKLVGDRPEPITTAPDMLRHLMDEGELKSPDIDLIWRRGEAIIRVPRSKDKGGKFFLNKKLLAAIDGEFSSRSGSMEAYVSQSNISRTFDALLEMGVTFTKPKRPVKD